MNRLSADPAVPDRPFVLICPTYAYGEGRSAVPKQVIRFLNDPARRAALRGSLRLQLQASALCDARGFAADFTTCLTGAWQSMVAGG